MKKYRIIAFIIAFLAILFSFGKISQVKAETDIPYDSVSFTPGYYSSYNQWTNSTSPVIKFTIESDENPTSCGITLHEEEDPAGGGDFEGNLAENGTNSYSCTVNLSNLENQKSYDAYIYVKSNDEYLLQFYYLYIIKPDFDTPVTSIVSSQQMEDWPRVKLDINISDVGSGVSYWNIYYRKDNGSWTKYIPDDPNEPSPMYVNTEKTGGDGKYDFYILATDKAGNVEQKSPVAECSVNVETQNTSDDNEIIDSPPEDFEGNEAEESPVPETPVSAEDDTKTKEEVEENTEEATENEVVSEEPDEVEQDETNNSTEEKDNKNCIYILLITFLVILLILIVLALRNKDKVKSYIQKVKKLIKNIRNKESK